MLAFREDAVQLNVVRAISSSASSSSVISEHIKV